MQHFYSHGKLLITGEYLVLQGALALAVPLKLGQSLTIESTHKDLAYFPPILHWQSYEKDHLWFSADFHLPDLAFNNSAHPDIAQTLQKILFQIRRLKKNFLFQDHGLTIQTHLEFDRTWGLGSSSTLIYNLAQWAQVDAFELLKLSLGGSGYDIACASSKTPILYRLESEKAQFQPIHWEPIFFKDLFFIYLGKKQNSQREVTRFQDKRIPSQIIDKISELTQNCIQAKTSEELGEKLEEHESILSQILERKTIQQEFFEDFPGTIKSLGAWGGDFILAIKPSSLSEEELRRYFDHKNRKVIFRYDELVL